MGPGCGHGLLVAEGDYGIDAGGAAGWEVAGEKASGQESDWGEEEGPRIEGGDAPELGLQNAQRGEGDTEAENDAAADKEKSFAKDEGEDIGGERAESHADAEFVGLQGDGIGHNTEETDEGESETDAGTSAE